MGGLSGDRRNGGLLLPGGITFIIDANLDLAGDRAYFSYLRPKIVARRNRPPGARYTNVITFEAKP